MTTTDLEVAIQNARHHLDGCEARLRDAARAHAEAQRILAAFPPSEAGRVAKVKLAVLEAEARVEETDAREQECRAVHTAARAQWTGLLRREDADAARTCLRTQLPVAQALVAAFEAEQGRRMALAPRLGVVVPETHPHQVARQLVRAIETALRALDPPPPALLPPPRPGTVRVKATKTFPDPDGGIGIVRRPGDVFDTREEFLRELVRAEVAAVVEVGG